MYVTRHVLELSELAHLIAALRLHGFTVIGPKVRDGAIVYDTLASAAELPIGQCDDQAPGSYRLRARTDAARFGYGLGPQSWKQFLHPPVHKLWSADRRKKQVDLDAGPTAEPKYAFLGTRACELSAIAIQDKVLMKGAHVNPVYRARREHLFVIAVTCGQAGANCFCGSMGTGPKAQTGFDLALTEMNEPERHYFVVEVGTPAGGEMLAEIPHRPATVAEATAADAQSDEAAQSMRKTLNTDGIKDLLFENLENSRWADIARRCLACANCTMVCPTCFCTTVEDVTDLSGTHAERWQKWDSCFTMDFTRLHGGSVRPTIQTRYRQWLTHKLASWLEQFGTCGCVGCGRCITWCPVGIDLTAEVQAIRENPIAPTRPQELKV